MCELLARAHLAAVPTSRSIWGHVAAAIDALSDTPEAPHQLVSRLLETSVRHPLVAAVPRSHKHARQVLQWLRDQWLARGWTIPAEFSDDAMSCLECDPEVFYKTYVGWGGGGVGRAGVTLLESAGGIAHNTTGLTTWCGAAVLAEWATDNPAIMAGRRVLELGAGVGFTACVILTTPLQEGLQPPTSYLLTDCHHHVLTLLHHNLALNLATAPPKREELEKFQREASEELVRGEVEAGEVVAWPTPAPQGSSPPAAVVEVSGACVLTKVDVLQVDWRRPPPLPPVDVVLAADVVYARHLIPSLVTLIRSILDGSASGQREGKPPNFETVDISSKNDQKQKARLEVYSQQNPTEEDEAKMNKEEPTGGKNNDEDGGATNDKNEKLERDQTEGPGRREREAFIACTRRSQETLAVFLEEVRQQGLVYSLVFQATLDTDTALFLYNEAHLPVKIYRITLPSRSVGSAACHSQD
ncbi:protein-lysine N-methyltransferase EEF2KMT [Procambarus clarkii]|uniref:protein-lysine N-methyltransferase EEF2KMT n=1 Tax=Procambarus clarkii TaxID=6728 RepID=UPI003743F738